MAAANQAPTILDYAAQLMAGTSVALALSVGGDPAASNRTGIYGDLTASAEKIQFVVGAQTGLYFQRNGSTVDAYFPGAVTISGNLTVTGTTTTINSTTVDVVDRVIRVNKTTGANDPVPSSIAGISVHRGAVASVARDTYGLFWDESATKWKLAVNTGADDATLGAYLNLQVLGLAAATGAFSGQITSTVSTGTAPLVIASTTNVANLNASSLNGATFAAPGTIGGGTPGAATFLALTASSVTNSSLTSGRVPFATTAGLMTDSANLQFGSGILAIGGTALTTFNDSTVTPSLQVLGTTVRIGTTAFTATAGTSSTVVQARSRGTTVGDYTAVQAGDALGANSFQGSDGTDFSQAVRLLAEVDAGATVSAGVVPGRLKVMTHSAAGSQLQALAVDSQQVTIFGASTTAGSTLYSGGTITPQTQGMGNSSTTYGHSIVQFRNNNVGPTYFLAKARSSTIGTMTIVTAADILGNIDWQGSDGTNFVAGARIYAKATGTPASTRMGASLILATATDAAPSVMTDALTIDNVQTCTFGATTDASSTTTGTVIISGGVGIAKKLYLGSDFNLTDAKNMVFGTSTGSQIGTGATQKLGFWGATPIAQKTGYGTPTGNVQTASFPGATATLLQTAQELAQLLLDLKAAGIIGA